MSENNNSSASYRVERTQQIQRVVCTETEDRVVTRNDQKCLQTSNATVKLHLANNSE